MSYTEIFYWLTVADNAKTFFGFFAILFCFTFILTQAIRIFSHVDNDPTETFYNRLNKWTWYSTPLMLLFLSLWIFTPSKRDALLIIAGGQTLDFITTDSVAKQIPHDVFNFVSLELQQMAKDAELDLGISTQKDKILDKVKTLTGEELIKLMKDNPEYKDLILNK